MTRALLVLAAALALAVTTAARADFPRPAGAINDFAGVLSDGEEQTLARLVADVEDATTAEIAVATVASLDGLTIEDYATQLFAAWGVGRAGSDNGVLIVVAPSERAMRIEVGYGLEGVLPDGLAGQIIRETFLPAFRDDAYGRGIVEGTTRVAAIVRRNQPLTDAEAQALASAGRSSNDALLPFVLVPFFGLFVGIGFGFAGGGLGARVAGPIVFGMVFGGVPLGMAWLMDVPGAAWILSVLAVAALVAGILWGRRPGGRASLRAGSTRPGRGWVWGGGGSSGSSAGRSSGSSRSSSSFGGGRSGGGGASGRW